MMKCIVTFYEQAKKVIAESKGEKKVTWGLIYTQLDKQFYELTKLKFKVSKRDDRRCQKRSEKYWRLSSMICVKK